MNLPQATPGAEYLKSVVQETLSTFQEGAGVYDGKPLPMTFKLAVQTLWRAIDDVFYREWPKDADRRVTLKVETADLVSTLKRLEEFGAWAVRACVRAGERSLIHVTGSLRRRVVLSTVLAHLSEHGDVVTDVVYGTVR